MEKLKTNIEKCTTEKQVYKVLEKYNIHIMKNDSADVGCFSVWINDVTRIYKPCNRKNMIFQTWKKTIVNYSGVPVFFG